MLKHVVILICILFSVTAAYGVGSSAPHIVGSYDYVNPETLSSLDEVVSVTINLEGLGGKVEDLDPKIRERLPIKPLDVVLVIDKSGSMDETDYYPDRITAAKSAAKTFIDLMGPNEQFAVVSFSDGTTVDSYFTKDKSSAKNNIDAINTVSSTALGEGIITALSLLEDSRDESVKAIIVLTDGMSNRGTSPTIAAEYARDVGIPIYSIGIGTTYDGLDETTLDDIASITGGEYLYAPDEQALTEVYEKLTNKAFNIAGLNIEVEINPSDFFEITSQSSTEFDTISVGNAKSVQIKGRFKSFTPNGEVPILSSVNISYVDLISAKIITETLDPIYVNIERYVSQNVAKIDSVSFKGKDSTYNAVVYHIDDEIKTSTKLTSQNSRIESTAYIYDDTSGETFYDIKTGANSGQSLNANSKSIEHAFANTGHIGSYSFYESISYNGQLEDFANENFYVVFDPVTSLSEFSSSTAYYGGATVLETGNYKHMGLVELNPKSDDILIIAEELAGGAANRYQAAKMLTEGINGKYMVPSDIEKNHESDSQILLSKKGDSSDFSALFISLARSLNIPARGVKIIGEEVVNGKITPIEHAFAEVYVDNRWVPADPHAMTFDDADLYMRKKIGTKLQNVKTQVEYAPGKVMEDIVTTLKYGLVATGPFSSNEIVTIPENGESIIYLTFLNGLDSIDIRNFKVDAVDSKRLTVEVLDAPKSISPNSEVTIKVKITSLGGSISSKELENIKLKAHYEAIKDGESYTIEKEYSVHMLQSRSDADDLDDIIENDESNEGGAKIISDPKWPPDKPDVVVDTPGFSGLMVLLSLVLISYLMKR